MKSNRALLLLSLAALAVHLPAISQYGYFRDELYYLASTAHLDFGYVDHPPLSILILAIQKALLGDSLVALRIVPALNGAAIVLITGLLARELGAGRFGQLLAGLSVLAAPVYLGTHHYSSMNSFDQLFWPLAGYILIRQLEDQRARLWPVLGLVLGLGLLNKISVLWLGTGIAAGLLLTPHRRLLATRGPWLAGAIALALFSPYVLWNLAHGLPTLEFMKNAAERKMVHLGPLAFAWNQVLSMNPGTAPIWVAGLAWCLLGREGRRWRPLGIIFLTACAILIVTGTSKTSYLSPAYPLILAPGAVAIEKIASRRGGAWLRAAAAVVVILPGLPLVPFAMPVLPPDTLVAYMHALGVRPPSEERQRQADLPQQYADMFGWDEMAEKAAKAYRSLTPDEQRRCLFFAQNYGEAGALDVLGPRYGLPAGRVMSGHNSYWIWGPAAGDWDVLIILGGDKEDNEGFFEEMTLAETIACDRCMPYERGLPVWIGKRPKVPLAAAWPRLKMYI